MPGPFDYHTVRNSIDSCSSHVSIPKMPTYRMPSEVDPLKKDSVNFPGPCDYIKSNQKSTERSHENSNTNLPEPTNYIVS